VTLTAQARTWLKSLDERLAHLTPNERAALAALVDRLRQRYGDDLLRVVLFGSKARGDFDDESDLDVLIVVRIPDADYWQHRREIVNLTADLMLEYSPVISPLINDEATYAQLRQWDTLLNRNIEQDGVELWNSMQSVLSFA
jgi:predicted nucleotidyltransferase